MKKKKVYRVTKSLGLFESQMTNEALSNLDNPLERLSELVDFEMFREESEKVLVKAEGKPPAGRPQIDVVMMFKVLVLQRYCNLSDRQTQYQITDRQSFRDFVGIHNVDDVPDEKTIWSQRDKLCKAGAFDRLFDVFRQHLPARAFPSRRGGLWMPHSSRRRAAATRVRRTPASRRVRAQACGGTTRTRNATRTPTPAGQRSVTRCTSATRCM